MFFELKNHPCVAAQEHRRSRYGREHILEYIFSHLNKTLSHKPTRRIICCAYILLSRRDYSPHICNHTCHATCPRPCIIPFVCKVSEHVLQVLSQCTGCLQWKKACRQNYTPRDEFGTICCHQTQVDGSEHGVHLECGHSVRSESNRICSCSSQGVGFGSFLWSRCSHSFKQL